MLTNVVNIAVRIDTIRTAAVVAAACCCFRKRVLTGLCCNAEPFPSIWTESLSVRNAQEFVDWIYV